MKILYFNDFRLGVLKGDNSVVDVTALVQDIPHVGPGDLINGLIERFSSYRQKLEQAVAQGQGVPLASVRIRPPLPKPTTIDCMAVNYMEDGTRSAPAPINAFHKSPSAIIGNGDTMVLPDVPATIFEGEAEMAVIIGKRASHVKAADAMDYVFGYTNFIDGSARGLPPGDIIATGTNHRGLNPFMDGDKVEIETEGLGRLTFNIKDELKRKWERKTRLQMHEAAKEKTAGNYPDITPQAEGKYAKTA